MAVTSKMSSITIALAMCAKAAPCCSALIGCVCETCDCAGLDRHGRLGRPAAAVQARLPGLHRPAGLAMERVCGGEVVRCCVCRGKRTRSTPSASRAWWAQTRPGSSSTSTICAHTRMPPSNRGMGWPAAVIVRMLDLCLASHNHRQVHVSVEALMRAPAAHLTAFSVCQDQLFFSQECMHVRDLAGCTEGVRALNPR